MSKFRMIGRVAVVVGATASVGALVVACSKTTDSSPGATCDRVLRAQVARDERCGGRVLDAEVKEHAIQREAAVCAVSIGLSGVAITPAFVDACVSALDNTSCAVGSGDLPECDAPPGTLEKGAACSQSSQCQSGRCDRTSAPTTNDAGVVSSSSKCGVCTAPIALGAACGANGGSCTNAVCDDGTCVARYSRGEGAACTTGSSDVCKSGLRCDVRSSKCAKPAAAGAACITSNECEGGLTCKSGVCKARAKDGEACGDGTDCASGLACAPTTQKCTRVTYGKAGAACDSNLARCAVGACNVSITGTGVGTGTCPVVLADGAACEEMSTDRSKTCDVGARCIEGKCKLDVPETCPAGK